MILLPLLAPALTAQEDEPAAYSAETLAGLHHIVDSLHALFNAMPPGPPVVSCDQTIGSFIRMWGDSTEIVTAASELDGGASIEYIATRYKHTITETRHEVVITRRTEDESGDRTSRPPTIYHAFLEPGNMFHSGEEAFADTSDEARADAKSRWVWHTGWVAKETEDGEARQGMMLEAILVSPDIDSPIIPEPYARMIRYAEFMVDGTTAMIPDREPDSLPGESYDRCEQRLVDMLDVPERPREADGGQVWDNDKRYRRWTNDYDARWVTMAHDPMFVEAVAATAEAAIREHVDDPELITTVERCMPNARGLDLVRRLPRQRSCTVPRGTDYRQMGAITRLTALTGQWPLFIKGHLIMLTMPSMLLYSPPRVNRSCTDELIAIGIELPALLLGMRMMPPPAARNYSWLNDESIVKAATEPYGREEIEHVLLDAIRDRALGNLERWKAYTLYLASVVRLSPDLRRARLLELQSGDDLPGYIREHLETSGALDLDGE